MEHCFANWFREQQTKGAKNRDVKKNRDVVNHVSTHISNCSGSNDATLSTR